jgi:hypothetical protein
MSVVSYAVESAVVSLEEGRVVRLLLQTDNSMPMTRFQMSLMFYFHNWKQKMRDEKTFDRN